MGSKILPIGKDDFQKIRENEIPYYYVDKTLMIKDFIQYGNEVALITRPRRFGKTLNMTMIRDFFDNTKDSRNIFEGLAIMDTEYADRINSVPVISLSFKGRSGKTMEAIKAAIAAEVYKEYKRHGNYLENEADRKDKSYLRYFQTLKALEEEKISEASLINSIDYLLEALHTFHGVRPIVLIDEYDNPIIEAHLGGIRSEFTQFFYASFLTLALKGNPHLGQALLTGIQRVAKESIFSKLNNIVVYTVLSKHYSPYFGLNREETAELLAYYDLDLNEEVSVFYDGYLFSGTSMYNPWSILSYANEKVLRSYWVKTSDNVLIKDSVLEAQYDFHRGFKKLIIDGKVSVGINLEASFAELPRTDTLWGLFVNAGYLTVTKEDYRRNRFTVRLPNEEVRAEFKVVVAAYTKLSSEMLQDMLFALTDGEMDNFFDIYQKLVLQSTSYHDSKENAYHMLMLGMVMHLRDLYNITSNIESGHGRSDIILESRDASRSHIVIEFKQGENVDELKVKALAQIHEKKYYAGLTGDILCIGIAHNKKVCKLTHEIIRA